MVDIDLYFNEQEHKFRCSDLIKLSLLLACNVASKGIKLEVTAHVGVIVLYLQYYCSCQSVVSMHESF